MLGRKEKRNKKAGRKESGKRKNAKELSSKAFYPAIALLVLITAALVYTLLLNFLNAPILETKEIYASLSVSGTTGIDINNTALVFGNIIPGASASRSIIFTNQYEFPVKLEIRTEGDISRFLRFENSIFVGKKEAKEIMINAVVPAGEDYADYSGKVVVSIKKAI